MFLMVLVVLLPLLFDFEFCIFLVARSDYIGDPVLKDMCSFSGEGKFDSQLMILGAHSHI